MQQPDRHSIKDYAKQMPCKFLIIRWSGMGDIVMTLPSVKWIKNHFENCHISYLTDIGFAKILEKSKLVNSIETIDRRVFKKPSSFFSAALDTISLVYRLRQKKFDMVFDLQGFGETAILAYLTGAPIRVGRIKKTPLRERIYNSPIHANWEHEHRSQYFLRAVTEACGYKAPDSVTIPKLQIQSGKIYKHPRLIGLNIGASTESRRWSEQNFVELSKRLSKKGFAIRLFLGPQEQFLVSAVKNICTENNWDFSFHNRLETLMSAISECSLMISNDTGPGHLAAVLGIPVVTLFSTGSPENVRPLTKNARWLRDKNDINRIKVSEVEDASIKLITSI